ncbi:hypothetical protein [Rhodococcus globerulus]|uniref:hypothetical protein n=1 Tax=Rhodococcus globerulus TaxID=33008 RepID=UPI000AE2AD8E|nr:hypothetical protein [Rhodococcus globerulus]
MIAAVLIVVSAPRALIVVSAPRALIVVSALRAVVSRDEMRRWSNPQSPAAPPGLAKIPTPTLVKPSTSAPNATWRTHLAWHCHRLYCCVPCL